MNHGPTGAEGNSGAPASLLAGWYADPAIVTIHDRWWLYPTTDGYPGWGANSFRAFSSPDLVQWTDHGEVLRLGVDVAWAAERAWAPALIERHGRCYLYFSADQNIGVAVSDNPAGPFADLGRPLVASGDYPGQMIDPSVFIDDDGAAYLYWGNGTAYGVPLNEDMMSFDPGEVRAWQPVGFREAPWVHRQGDVYFLTWSENDTRSEDYRVRYATGSSPLGPWEHRGLILEKDPERNVLATGHHSIARAPGTDRWVIAFHQFSAPGGSGYRRQIMFAPLEHDGTHGIFPVSIPGSPLQLPLAGPGLHRTGRGTSPKE